MAQTKKKRRRKHRGTQAGSIDRAAHSSHKGADPKAESRRRREERLSRPPSWRSAINRAAIAAVLFGVIAIVLLGQRVAAGVSLAAVMLLLYIPVGYYTDLLIYRRRQARRQASGGARGRR